VLNAIYKATGKRYDVGRSCVRFRRLDDLPLDVIGEAVAATPLRNFIEQIEKDLRAARVSAAKTAKPARSKKK